MPNDGFMIGEPGSARAHVDGLMAWWALAGLDSAIAESPANWLKLKQAVPHSAVTTGRHVGFPETLEAFHDFLALSEDLPEAVWPGPRILPAGPAGARLMIITHAPDASGRVGDMPFDADGIHLLGRMIKTLGLSLPDCYVASLSLVSPAGSTIDPKTLEALATRMRHHIGIVAPASLLLLGDQANRALNPTSGLDVTKNLPFVNHSRGIVPAAAIAHPRLMLGQPMAKAGAWRMLRELVKGWGL